MQANIDTSSVAYFHPHATRSYLCWGKKDNLVGMTEWSELDAFIDRYSAQFIYGFISYDVKNKIEQLSSKNPDNLHFPLFSFHVPEHVFAIENNELTCIQGENTNVMQQKARIFLQRLQSDHVPFLHPFLPRISKEKYIEAVKALQDEIQRGNIYEINFCQEFFSTHNTISDPLSVFSAIDRATKAPFSCYLQEGNHHIFCASPERFLQKNNMRLLSQPIKGTAGRGVNKAKDEQLKNELGANHKEQTENIMIVDLVRNDLSKIALKGSVQVEELLGLYTFETVHQLISSVSCRIASHESFSSIIRATFPMGSMTGVPKVRAMQLIEQYESFSRGLYSGTIGYFLPNGDFDFNVVIRSVLYNAQNGYLSCGVGGAITINSDPEQEYMECLTKINKLLSVLTSNDVG